MTRVMSALKNGALLKAVAGIPPEDENAPFPYVDRVVLNKDSKKYVNNISNVKQRFLASSNT